MKVLIVDDSALIQQRILEMLSEYKEGQLDIDQAVNAEETFAYCSISNPDVMILDINLPRINGIRILEKIKKINKEVKVIMLTNYPYPEYKKRCLALGADYFLEKTKDFESIPIILSEIQGNLSKQMKASK